MLTEHVLEFCQVSPGPLPRSACGPGYEAASVPGSSEYSVPGHMSATMAKLSNKVIVISHMNIVKTHAAIL